MGFFDFLKDALSLDSFYTETSATPPGVSGVDADPAATRPVVAVEPPRPTGYVADQPTEYAIPAASQMHPASAEDTAGMPAVAGQVQKDLPILLGHGEPTGEDVLPPSGLPNYGKDKLDLPVLNIPGTELPGEQGDRFGTVRSYVGPAARAMGPIAARFAQRAG